MELLIVASIAIVSVSFVTMQTVKLILSSDINLARNINVISNKDS